VNDRVVIAAGSTVTYDRQSDADIACVKVSGQLTFRTDVSTRLTVGTLMVMPGAGLQIGTSASPIAGNVTAEIVISDRPIDTGIDPEQFGTGLLGFGRVTMHGAVKSPTFVRLTSEVNAGQSSLSLAAGVSGWHGGDRIVIPGTNQAIGSDLGSYQGQWETPTLASASGSSLALAGGLAFAHGGGRNAAGALAFLPHVGNISRNITIRSQNPNGTRGHVLMTDRAEVDIRYVAFKDLGRTQISPLDSATLDSSGHATHIGSNQIGRYSLHMHHLFGPASPPANSYQYVLIGNAIDGGTKWGITIHNTHYGLVQDNVVYNAGGAGIMTEDGSETANVIQNNFIVRAWGTGDERADGRQGSNDWGWEGSGIWLRGPDNYIRNNVIANSNSYAVTYMMLGVSNVRVPNAPGDNPLVSGRAVNMMAVPLREFSSNEFYSTHRGITTWNLGAFCCMEVYDVPVSTFLNTRMWHVGRLGFYGYGQNRVTFDGWVHYNDPSYLSSPFENPMSIWFGDYIARNTIVRNADIQGLRIGIFAPIKAGDTRDIYGHATGTLLVENSTLKNYWNIYMSTPYGVTGGGSLIPPRLVIARNIQFANVPGVSNYAGQAHIFRHFILTEGPNLNIIVSDRAVVESFNGNSTDNFEVFASAQAPSFVIPSTELTTSIAGMTNQQAWNQAKLAISGAVAPCSATRLGIEGFVCPAGSLPSLPSAPTSPTPTPTPPPPSSSTTNPISSPGGCTTADPFASLGGGTCVNGVWVAPSTSSPTPTPTGGCTTPDPYLSLGGGTCVNGVWVAPTTSSPTPTTGGCTTPDPFISLGGGTCVNGGWLPPTDGQKKGNGGNGGNGGSGSNGGNSGNGGNGGNGNTNCKGPDPFKSLGGGTCVNGGWVPPPTTTTAPTLTPGGCTTPDPFVSLGGGTCVNGGWLPPSLAPTPTPTPTPTPAPSPTGCTTPDPFINQGGGTCVNGVWVAPTTPTPLPAPQPPSSSLPAPGVPTTSTITLISGPTTIPETDQQLWKFQSVEGPNWDTARWGTNTHRFNVTIVPGSGALPVILMLHGAGDNGPVQPPEFINRTTPGIYVSPVDIAFYNGLIDPVTGTTRYYSKWQGYQDANGIYQPVTADRVVRYVQWVLTQTQRWNPDPNRVYTQGGSMGGGGALHIALQYPAVFAAGVSGTAWIDDDSWASGGGDCAAGVRWRTASGPTCKQMMDAIYLVQNPQGRRVPLFLTWNSNDNIVSPAKYPTLLAVLESVQHPYMAEWHFDPGEPHHYFLMANAPFLNIRLNATPTLIVPTGSNPADPSGTRRNIGGF